MVDRGRVTKVYTNIILKGILTIIISGGPIRGTGPKCSICI